MVSTNVPTVDTLDWQPHWAGMGGESAVVYFENGYGASVLRGGFFYTTGGTFEIAVLNGEGISYNTPLTDNVLGYLSEAEANTALQNIAALPNCNDEAAA